MAYHLAQLNIGRLSRPLDHPEIADFVNGLDHINRLAEASPGFVWRLQSAAGNATDIPWSADPLEIVNMSVWTSPEELKNYVYRSEHLDFYLRRADWFERPSRPHYALWWIPAGAIPTLDEARERLEHYRTYGATPHAFWFGKLFPAPEELAAPALG
jgi:hypothetical protein